jgi:hypothetical protein
MFALLLVACFDSQTEPEIPVAPVEEALAEGVEIPSVEDMGMLARPPARKAGKRRGRKGRSDKDKTRAFASFQTAASQDFDPHVVGHPAPTTGDPVESTVVSPEAQLAAELAALGYVDGEIAAEAGSVDGIRTHDAARAWQGYNLYTPAGQSIAQLLDMNGNEVHRWAFEVDKAWPAAKRIDGDPNADSFRRAELLPNGDLVAIWSGYGIVRLDKDSRLKWGHFLPVHHDFVVQDDGSVIVLTRIIHERPEYGDDTIVEDFLTWLEPDGAVRGSISVLEAFEAYDGFEAIWAARPKKDRDLFHTNALFEIDADYTHLHPAFEKGNLLTSMRHLEVIAVLDTDTYEVVWAFDGDFAKQHDPQVVTQPEPRILVFDNRGGPRETSRVLEYALPDMVETWRYQATPPTDFETGVCGHAQRLPNGNTLINESTKGRVFEVTREGEVVWDWRTSFRAGPRQLIARTNEFTRVAPEDVAWLTAPR